MRIRDALRLQHTLTQIWCSLSRWFLSSGLYRNGNQ